MLPKEEGRTRQKLWINSPDEKYGPFNLGDALCPCCGTELALKDNYESKIFPCLSCGAKFRIESIAYTYVAIRER